ncbi:MAG: protein translocase subunit SecF [Clostridia bacterium]|nr:protein translocase subunit SecF [Clostridia bacterium]
MRKFNIDFNKALKPVLLVYIAIFVIGIIWSVIFGVKLDINFSGGAKVSYSYTGEIATKDIETIVDKHIKKEYSLSQSTSLAGDTQTFEIALSGKNALSAKTQEAMTKDLVAKFKDNKIELYNSNSVSPTIAGSFFAKSLVAVLITAVLVVIYVGIRFRKIGGVSAGITALVSLVFDVLITFFVCVIFGLQIDSNYIAVVLTMLGYSLNDTIVIYDRIRENRKYNPDMEIGELVNTSVNTVIIRNIVTTATTLLAVTTIIVVSEIFGLTSLRTFAIPMVFGLLSGAVSSLFVSGPLWVIWRRRRIAKGKK